MRWIVAGLVLALVASADAAAQTRCQAAGAVVYATDNADVQSGCAAAGDGTAFLAAQGLDTNHPIEIRFVEVIPDLPPEVPALGCFVRSQQRIYMLAFEQCRTRVLAYGLEVDRTMHRALVAHEVAHSLLVANTSRGKLGVVAQEYIAYVTMFATMPDSYRQAVLQKIPGTGFATEAEINLTIYLLDPVRFGAQAYRHFSEPANGSAFLRRILNRQALVEDNPP
jgi:hypothetical protein